MRYKPTQKMETRERIIAATAELIYTHSRPMLSIKTIMQYVGLTPGTFYLHFRSKDDLLATTIDALFDRTIAWIREQPNAASALAAFVTHHLASQGLQKEAMASYFPTLSEDISRSGKEARKRFRSGVRQLVSELRQLASSLGCSEREASELAYSLLAQLAGTLSLARGLGDDVGAAALLEANKGAMIRRVELAESHPTMASSMG